MREAVLQQVAAQVCAALVSGREAVVSRSSSGGADLIQDVGPHAGQQGVCRVEGGLKVGSDGAAEGQPGA